MANEIRTNNNAASACDFSAIVPSDTVDFTTQLPFGIYVGVGGNIVAVTLANVAVTFTGVLAGSVIPIRFRRINATSTTATNLVALY